MYIRNSQNKGEDSQILRSQEASWYLLKPMQMFQWSNKDQWIKKEENW